LTPIAKSYKLAVMPACKLTPDVEETILNLVGAGNTLIHAARAAGVVAETAKNWVKWGETGREPYKAFAAKLDVASARSITNSVDAIKIAAQTDWRAAKYHLEYIEKSRAAPQSIAHQLESILQVMVNELGVSEAKRVLRAIIEGSGDEETGDAAATLRLISG
jgi:hypothetical protein